MRLGYGIEADDGPSGRRGQWAVAGVPAAALEAHSKRAAEITAETHRRGFDSYRARGIVARDNRAPKGHQPVADLMARWKAELEAVGWPVGELERSVAKARSQSRRPGPYNPLSATASWPRCSPRRRPGDRQGVLPPRCGGGGGPQALRPRAGRAGPHPRWVLADPEAVPPVATPMAREWAYATATVIATEQAIAAAVEIEVSRIDRPGR